MENLVERSGTTDVSITSKIQEIEEIILDVENMVEKIDTTVKENSKHKKSPNPKHTGNYDKTKRPNLRIIGIEENEDSYLKDLKISSTKS